MDNAPSVVRATGLLWSISVKMNDYPPADAACSPWVLMHKFQRCSLSSGRGDSYPHEAPGDRKNLPSPMLEHLLHHT